MKTPRDIVDTKTVLLEGQQGVVEVEFGLFENDRRWYVLLLDQKLLSGKEFTIAEEQVRNALELLDWPKLRI